MTDDAGGARARAATPADAAAIARIYNEGIEDRVATFETKARSVGDVEAWFDGAHPIVVVERAGEVVAFASTSSYRPRACYAAVAEFAVYVARAARRSGAGGLAMVELARAAERAGLAKLVSRVFVENRASRALLASQGFREVGVYERHGALDGVEKDVVIVEKLLRRGDRPRLTARGEGGKSLGMHPWHDIPFEAEGDIVTAFIEIPKGSKVKYELDKETGLLKVDRILFSAVHYPANYGFLPQTYADDGDPLDILVLCQEPVEPMCIMRARPVGYLQMRDDKGIDDKIVAVHVDDPAYEPYHHHKELPQHVLRELRRFFEDYKQLEDKMVVVDEMRGPEEARKVIEAAKQGYIALRAKKA